MGRDVWPGLQSHGLASTFCCRGRFVGMDVLPRIEFLGSDAVKPNWNSVPTLEPLRALGRELYLEIPGG